MTRWRNNGIESTSKAPVRMAAGLGPIKADSQLCEITQDILQRCLVRRKKGLLSIPCFGDKSHPELVQPYGLA